MSQAFEQGDTVEWNTPQGRTRGAVKRTLTSGKDRRTTWRTQTGATRSSTFQTHIRGLSELRVSATTLGQEPEVKVALV